MSYVVGTCGDCGGPVSLPEAWAVRDPIWACCERCGAKAQQQFGAPLPMQTPPSRVVVKTPEAST